MGSGRAGGGCDGVRELAARSCSGSLLWRRVWLTGSKTGRLFQSSGAPSPGLQPLPCLPEPGARCAASSQPDRAATRRPTAVSPSSALRSLRHHCLSLSPAPSPRPLPDAQHQRARPELPRSLLPWRCRPGPIFWPLEAQAALHPLHHRLSALPALRGPPAKAS